jgi:catechol 2,3-dioxygenase-like lactoylglutathione lyase family enzyme
MKLNHLDLQVSDVQSTVLFFERYFGFSLSSSRSSPAIAILNGEDSFVLVLQKKKSDEAYPSDFHFGFLVGDVATVERLHRELTTGGEDVSDVQVNGRGTMIYCRHAGFMVEVSCRERH